ncbi:DUF3037 domain-containing protein [Dyadobacter sp. CY327]|uniref:DUF3037 domain-containing protein n=1 Tax=Dyadobacter sp. CY327 TaxID=2907301 RepID=UPI00286DCC19|nr:DUF3037 domain-containing protein [Dyadobacter sp. CY327]
MMQEQHLFEYAVIRVVPRVEREEFVNVGVILFCPSKRFLECTIELNAAKLRVLSESLDLDEVSAYLNALKLICLGKKEGGTIAALPPASRFRWLTATRSTVIQSSKVHPGFCREPEVSLGKLFDQMVR